MSSRLRLAALAALFSGVFLCAARAAPAAPSSFDGAWAVDLTCPATAQGRADGWEYRFTATVKDGVLHGERGARGEPGWLQLDGPIGQGGEADLIAEGLTNIPKYALYNVKKGTPYKHAVQARFETARGTGAWTTIRTCNFTFEKR
jgi:hypothetical protein